jgi:tRNA(Ile)-lysidine synthase
MTVQTQLLAKLAAEWPADQWREVTVLVAISGGADSVALARALHELRAGGEGRLVLAHYNHQLRGEESDGDQAFVEELGRRLGVEVVVGRKDGEREGGREGEREGATPEEALRELRYGFLAKAADQVGARHVVTAHTADDQVETVLHNILRGTGLAGLAGIPRVRPLTEAATLVRPLLLVTRTEVLDYLAAISQTYREDSSNQLTNYTRNRIRRELLPLLEQEFNADVRAAILRLSRIAEEADDLVSTRVRRLLSHIKRLIPGGVELQTRPLTLASDLIARAALKQAWTWQGWPLGEMSFERWNELLAFARAPSAGRNSEAAPRMFPGSIRAEKQGGVLRLIRPD